jgi:hypothetical protein
VEWVSFNGFYLLATRSRLRGLPNGVYEISKASIALLDEHSIRYVLIAAPKDATNESQALRNPLTVEL